MNFVLTEKKPPLFYITLNRPDKRNALNSEFVAELTQAFKEADEDESTRVVILKANGSVFSAGADLAYLQQLQKNTFEENLEDSSRLKELFELIYTHGKIVIAQVEGHALAGGCGLATVCDFTFSVPDAQFGYTEVKIGFVPAIVMFFLLRKIGEGNARKLLLTGEKISAGEVQRMGLINEVIPPAEISARVEAFALQLAKETSPQSVSLIKRMLAEIQSFDMQEALDYAAEQNAFARSQEDCKKGIQAFLNKEELKWD